MLRSTALRRALWMGFVLILLSGCGRAPPQINGFTVGDRQPYPGQEVSVGAMVTGAGPFTYHWTAQIGNFDDDRTNPTTYIAPAQPGECEIFLELTDKNGLAATGSTEILVREERITPSPTPTPIPDTDVTIDFPSEGEVVTQVCVVGRGTYTAAEDMEIWVMVHDRGSNRYYPQSNDVCEGKPAVKVSDTDWETQVCFGDPGRYDVEAFLALADSEATKSIKQYLTTACEEDNYPGLSPNERNTLFELGLEKKDAVTVERQ